MTCSSEHKRAAAVCPHFTSKAQHQLPVVKDNETTPTSLRKSVFPQQIFLLAFLPVGSHNKEPVATYCDTKQGRQIYASSAAEDRRESAEEGEEEEEEEEGREEEEEQRPLCSGVLGYPLVRDHTLGLGLSGAPDAQAGDGTQEQAYKGDETSTFFIPTLVLISNKGFNFGSRKKPQLQKTFPQVNVSLNTFLYFCLYSRCSVFTPV